MTMVGEAIDDEHTVSNCNGKSRHTHLKPVIRDRSGISMGMRSVLCRREKMKLQDFRSLWILSQREVWIEVRKEIALRNLERPRIHFGFFQEN